MIIILDTNCLIHILGKKAEHRWLFDEILDGKIKLAVSTPILSEYAEILDNFFESKTLGNNITTLFLNLPGTIRSDIFYQWQLIEKDPDDNKFVDCAIAANAEYIITDDAHFKILKRIAFPKVLCLRLEEFSEIYQEK